jgi:hypothetical protein
MAVATRAPTKLPLHVPQFPSKCAVRLLSSTRKLSAQMFPKSLALQVPGRCAATCPSRTASWFPPPLTARTFRRSCVVSALISTQNQSHVRYVDLALQSHLAERKERERRVESKEKNKSAIVITLL